MCFFRRKEKATGAAMVVAPGGGHRQLVIEKEGWEIADWLNSNGIAAIVLKYRLAKAPNSKYTLPEHVYADAARAMRLVRSNAKAWNVDPGRIGFAGFSAGGEVAGIMRRSSTPVSPTRRIRSSASVRGRISTFWYTRGIDLAR